MAIRHLFLWSVADDARDGAAVLAELSALAQLVPGLRNWAIGPHVGKDVHSSSARYDYALTCDFDSAAELSAYEEHPAHQQALQRVFPLYADWAVVDLEL